MNKELKALDDETLVEMFISGHGVDSEVDKARDLVNNFEHDMKNATTRKKSSSLAYHVRKFKTKLDECGKMSTESMKAKIKLVDKSRKKMREDLDKLALIARQPVTDWEEAEAVLETERQAKAELKRIAEQKETAHELADLMNDKYDRDAKDAAQREELERANRERVAKLAKEENEQRVRNEAKAKAESDKLKAEAVAYYAVFNSDHSDALLIESKKQAVIDLEAAKKLAAENEIIAAETARIFEVKRQCDIIEAEEEAQRKREANTRHIGKIRKAAKEALIEVSGITEDQAKKIVLSINALDIPAVFIKY